MYGAKAQGAKGKGQGAVGQGYERGQIMRGFIIVDGKVNGRCKCTVTLSDQADPQVLFKVWKLWWLNDIQ